MLINRCILKQAILIIIIIEIENSKFECLK